MKKYQDCLITENRLIAEGIYDMRVLPPTPLDVAAGQFAMIYTGDPSRLLPRPISFCGADGRAWRFVYRVVGGGTEKISRFAPGQSVKILAPLGNGFPIPEKGNAALVGGGLGVPPLLMLAKNLERRGISVSAFLGFRDTPILLNDFNEAGAKVNVATDGGSFGFRGSAADLFARFADRFGCVFTCGPEPMMEAVAEVAAAHELDCFVSLEKHMACGVGACFGCSVGTADGYKKCCSYGPVFDAKEVIWNVKP